jgi:hypothetical protein
MREMVVVGEVLRVRTGKKESRIMKTRHCDALLAMNVGERQENTRPIFRVGYVFVKGIFPDFCVFCEEIVVRYPSVAPPDSGATCT